jgi:hypothetical protein
LVQEEDLVQEDNKKESSQLGTPRQEPLRDEVLELLFGSSSTKRNYPDKTVQEHSLEELLQSGGSPVAEKSQNASTEDLSCSVPYPYSDIKADSQEVTCKDSDVECEQKSQSTEISASETKSTEAVHKIHQSDFWQRCLELAREQQWEEINALSSRPSGIAAHEARYWWICSQYHLKEFPVAILIAPLQHLLEGHLEAGLENSPTPDNPYEFGVRDLTHEFVKSALQEEVNLVQVYPLLCSIRKLFGEQYAFVSEEHSVVEMLQNKPEYERTPLEKNILDELQELGEERFGAKQYAVGDKERPRKRPYDNMASTENFHQASEGLETNLGEPLAQRGRGDGARRILLFFLEGAAFAGALIGLFFFIKETVFQGDSRLEDAPIAFTPEFPVSQPQLALPAEEEVIPRIFKGMLLDAEQRSTAETHDVSITPTGEQGEIISDGKKRLAAGSDTIDMTGPLEPEGLMEEIREKQQRLILSDEFVRGIGSDLIGKKKAVVPQAETRSPQTTIAYRVLENASVRKEPSENADVIEYLTAGSQVHVLKRIGEWLVVVSRNGNIAFLKGSNAAVIQPKRSKERE